MKVASNFLWNSLTRIRRNHALEHATLQVVARDNPHLALAGYSDSDGFWVVGDVSTDALRRGVEEAANRLRAGEYGLAIHPACGTNFVVSGLVAGTAAWFGMLFSGSSFKRRLENWPVAVALVTLALILAQPLGPRLQQGVTTQPNIGKLEVTGINVRQRNGAVLHRILTRG